MADEDLDLEDDDLDLGGDDFAGELDDMMGDEELGGGSAGGGEEGDSELDSFFEDLSSIEDMDEGASEPAPAAAKSAAGSEAKEEAAPAKKKKAAPKEKKEGGGKLKYFILLLLLLAIAAGAYYWFYMRTVTVELEEEPLMVDPPIQMIEIEKPTIPRKSLQPVIEVEPPPAPAPQPAKPPVSQKKYLVQVATCTFDVCKEDFANSLRQAGEPVFQRSSGEKYDFIELISSQVFSYREASEFANEINVKNKLAGKASVKAQSNGYRISMGSFPALDRAKEVKFSIEEIFPVKNVTFNLEHVRKDYTTTKIYAGPYASRSEAKKVLMELRAKEKFKGAFVVLY